jgi:CDGSH-type Zn-finger protein
MAKGKIVVTKNGPYMVSGKLPLGKEIAEVGGSGDPEIWAKGKDCPEQETYALCRCGQSKNKPYCDGTHVQVKFDGTETTRCKKYDEQAQKIEGPGVDLTDAQNFCSSGRFCHSAGGTWSLTENSVDPKAKKMAIQEAGNCPSGRLVAVDKKSGKAIEPEFKPSLSLIEDPQAGVSGPIWVKGKVPVESAAGKSYEPRNRVTLCRCGKSQNKPFCDGRHIQAKFNDGDESLK